MAKYLDYEGTKELVAQVKKDIKDSIAEYDEGQERPSVYTADLIEYDSTDDEINCGVMKKTYSFDTLKVGDMIEVTRNDSSKNLIEKIIGTVVSKNDTHALCSLPTVASDSINIIHRIMMIVKSSTTRVSIRTFLNSVAMKNLINKSITDHNDGERKYLDIDIRQASNKSWRSCEEFPSYLGMDGTKRAFDFAMLHVVSRVDGLSEGIRIPVALTMHSGTNAALTYYENGKLLYPDHAGRLVTLVNRGDDLNVATVTARRWGVNIAYDKSSLNYTGTLRDNLDSAQPGDIVDIDFIEGTEVRSSESATILSSMSSMATVVVMWDGATTYITFTKFGTFVAQKINLINN